MTVINGGVPDRVPVALHNFLLASAIARIPLSQCLKSGELLAEAQIAAWRIFRHDALLVENGTTAMAQAIGCEAVYSDTVAPRIVDPVLKDLADVDRLRIPDPETTYPLSETLKAIRLLRREFGDSVFIMGRADQAPMALAAAIHGMETFWLKLADEENSVAIERVLDFCLEANMRYALALKNAGAHGTCIGEVGSDIISPAMYRRFVLPRLTKFFAAMRKADFPAAVHQCGNTVAVLPEMVASGAHILELDPKTDMATAKAATRGKAAVLGMVDPANVVHLGTPELVELKTREAIDVMAPDGGFIVGPGCALVPETPVENVQALIATAQICGIYRQDGSLAPAAQASLKVRASSRPKRSEPEGPDRSRFAF